jgi:RimJ/RimL family protein N-acetyltransferase
MEPNGHVKSALSVIGDKVALGPLRREAIPIVASWFDLETMRTADPAPLPVTEERVEQWYGRAALAEEEHWFLAYARESLEPIGLAGLTQIDHRHGTAEHNVIVGAKELRERGHSTEISALLLDYAFTVLGLNNVWVRVYENDPAGISAYQQAGFREIGRRHQSRQIGRKLWDTLLMECLAEEFESPVLGPTFRPDLYL